MQSCHRHKTGNSQTHPDLSGPFAKKAAQVAEQVHHLFVQNSFKAFSLT